MSCSSSLSCSRLVQKYHPLFDDLTYTVIVVLKILILSHKEIFFLCYDRKVSVCLKISKRVVNSVIQTVHDGRQFMKYIDPKLGVALPERDYGGNCLIYDPGNITDPFHNLWVRRLFISFKLLFYFRFDASESTCQTLAFRFSILPSFHLHPSTLALGHSFLWIRHCYIFI